MDKKEIVQTIEEENGAGFSRNIEINGYNFFKDKTFISFKIYRIRGVNVVTVSYIHSESRSDFLSVLAYAANFWMGKKVKFIYFKEKERKTSRKTLKELQDLGFKVSISTPFPDEYKYPFECCHDGSPCRCQIYEAHT